jgi:glycosyltransferase involved in cell wall biosynthesis
MRLGVIGHVPHWTGLGGAPVAFEPYVREMRIWADLFREVEICSPAGDGEARGNLAPYLRENFEWRRVRYTILPHKPLQRLVRLPGLARAARRTILGCDFILLRSPGHFGLVGTVMVRSMRRASLTKWACENAPFEGERFVMRLERRLTSVPNPRNPVLVYGPAKLPHQISFIPALMSSEELAHSRHISSEKAWAPPWQIVSVGRQVPEKGFDLALRGLAELRRSHPELDWHFTLIGDGYARKSMEALSAECGLGGRVTFPGALTFQEVQHHYARAHVVIMPGVKEGWPKVIAEAWAHGAVPVAALGGIVSSIIPDGTAGVVFQPTPAALASALHGLLADPERATALAQGIYSHADDLSLDRFRDRLVQVLVERCCLK